MEEIIGFIPWYQNNKKMIEKRFPKICKIYDNVSTEGFAFAVFEELIFCIIICVISLLAKWYGLWLGGLIGCTLHFVIHIIQALVIKRYFPALITSVIALPIGCIVIQNSLRILKYSIMELLIYSVMGIVFILLNIWFVHKIMKWFTLWQSKS